MTTPQSTACSGKRKREEGDDAFDGSVAVSASDAYLATASDVQLVLTGLVREAFGADGALTTADTCRGVFLHQLYASLGNKTSVDADVAHLLRVAKGLKVLHSTATIKGCRPVPTIDVEVLMPLATYLADIEHSSVTAPHAEGVRRFLDVASLHASKAQVLLSELVAAGSSFSSADVADVVKAGFLYRKTSLGTDVVYAFSHPRLRRHQQRVDAARAAMLALVKSTRGKEMSERALRKKLDTPLGFRFVALDALGLCVLEKMQSTRDVFYRIPAERP